ncbi:hypothetical protein ACIQVU_19860 [Lysinibacillus sp. NPDC098008]
MAYQWTQGDIAVVQKYLRENDGNEDMTTAALLGLVQTSDSN